MQKSMVSSQNQMKEAPEFFKELEEKFMNQLTEMGYDYTDIKDFIEDKGLPELDLDYAIESMNKKDAYRNPLFIKPAIANNSISYDYHDPMSKPPISFAINPNSQAPQSVKPGMPLGGQNMLKNYDTDLSMIQPSEYD